MSRARELAKFGGSQQTIAGLSSHVGVSTFAANVFMYNDCTVSGNLNVTGDLSYDEVSARNQNITGITTVVDLIITRNASVAGILTATKGLTGNLNSTGVSTAAFLQATTVNATGIVTASSFSGSGASLTTLNASNISSGIVTAARLGGNGTASASTYLRGDGTWSALTAPNNGTLTLAVSGTGLSGSASFTADQSSSSTFTVTSNATSANTVSAIVARDASGNFSAGTITAALVGNVNATGVSTAAFLQATTVNVSAAATVGGNLTVTGDLTVNGTTTTVNSTTVTVDDKNLELGSVASPTDITADGGGITLKGATDKTITWSSSASAWTSSEDINVVTGKQYEINGTAVLTSTQVLGKAVPSGVIVGTTDTQTLTNKTIAAGSNTISGLTNSNLSGTAGITNANLANSTISGVALGSNLNTLTMGVSGTGLSGSTTYNGSGAATFTVTSNATNANTASAIVARDASGNFSAGTITAALTGNVTGNCSGSSGSCTGNSATATNVAYSGLTGAVPTWNQNTTGTASNITAYTINQSVGTGNGPTFAGLTLTSHLQPNANNTLDCGSSAARWRNVYSNDLDLSNEGKGNSVDGTWGSYLVQEGEEHLYIINRRSGKKFRFMLEEV